MRIARTQQDKDDCEAIINHPSIRSHVWPGTDYLEAPIDTMDFWLFDGGVIVGEAMGDGEYLCVSAFLPGSRGTNCVVAHRKLMDEYFFKRDALVAYGTIAPDNNKSLGLEKGLGSAIWDCSGRKVSQMSWIQWALKSRTARDAGRVFKGFGITDDQSRVLGAFSVCAANGWVGKGFAQYNKFAKLAGVDELIPVNTRNGLFSIGKGQIKVVVS